MAQTVREAVRQRLQSLPQYPEGRFEGRGIVICAGGLRYFVCAWVLIAVLRRVHRVELPIQVWHLGSREMSEEMRLLLEDLHVEVVDAEAVVGRLPARIAGGWPLKPYAILNSRFREVLYLDADTVPLVDPLAAFNWPIYRESGMVMWPDIMDIKATNPIWEAFDLPPQERVSVEAGLLVVDKQRVWNVLDLAMLLNEHVEEVYSAIYGDKDTFLVASLILRRAPALIPHRPFEFDIDFVQCDPDGEPFLQHRTGAKWNLHDPNRGLASAQVMVHCEQALAELRELWSGAVFNAPPRSKNALTETKRLIAARDFLYEPQGTEGRWLVLLPGGRVGEGNGVFERHWAVVERDGALILQFYSATRLAVELFKVDDGSWKGRCLLPAGFQAQLTEEEAHRTWPNSEPRIARSAAECVAALLDTPMFASGFDHERGRQLHAALLLINDLFDDVPEQIGTHLRAQKIPEPWRKTLADAGQELASARNNRLRLSERTPYPNTFDLDNYTRIP